MKIAITGTTRGLGKSLAEHFKNKGCHVIELNRHDSKIEPAIGCDVYINNTYGNGLQIELFNELLTKVKKMIVMGSIASDYPDPNMPVYSQHKKELKERVLEVVKSKETNRADILLLQLTGASYNDTDLIKRTIDFWIDNPQITLISFIPGESNE